MAPIAKKFRKLWPEPQRSEAGCNYHGQFFGAPYPDACCVGGYLWDEDSGESTEDGWRFDSGGEFPCPNCNRDLALFTIVDDWSNDASNSKRGKYPRRVRPHRARAQIRKHLLAMRNRWGFFGDSVS